jgi:high-affinity iron transporter
MLQALLVTFREGLESFLIVGVIVAYLRKTNRVSLIRGVRAGVGVALGASLAGAWLWLQVPNQPLYEGIAALVAAVFVGMLLWQTLRMGRRIKGEIEERVARVAGAEGAPASLRALASVGLITTLLVTRELLEAVFYLGVQVLASRASEDHLKGALLVGGAALGIVAAAAVAWSWTKLARKLNLGVVLKVTALFLGLFLVQLVIYGVHELAESGVIHGSQAFHDATEVFGPDGWIGHIISYSLLAAPLLYIFLARRMKAASAPRPPATA